MMSVFCDGKLNEAWRSDLNGDLLTCRKTHGCGLGFAGSRKFYVYTKGDPVNFVDRDGEFATFVSDPLFWETFGELALDYASTDVRYGGIAISTTAFVVAGMFTPTTIGSGSDLPLTRDYSRGIPNMSYPIPEELICPPIEKKRNKHEKNKDKTARQKKKTQRGRRNIDSDDPDADPVTVEKYNKKRNWRKRKEY